MIVIRCIWGDFNKECRLTKVWKDVKRAAKDGEQSHCLVYVYGKHNYEELTKLGFDCVLLNHKAFPDGKRDWHNGKCMVRPWHYKFEMIRAVVGEIGEPIVYCDFDVKVKQKPNEKWESWFERKRNSVALSLYRYRRWRPTKIKRSGESRHLTPSGNWLWVANDLFPNAVLDMMYNSPPDDYASWHDEYAMNDVIDQKHGGWPGEQVWLEDYESPIMVQKRSRSPWDSCSIDSPVSFNWDYCFTQ